MIFIKKYVYLVHRLIEVPRNELRCEVEVTKEEVISEVLDKYEKAYLERCLELEKIMDLEMQYIRRFKS
jgi:predicted nucleotidyltransferase